MKSASSVYKKPEGQAFAALTEKAEPCIIPVKEAEDDACMY